jgi:hypothetical protein
MLDYKARGKFDCDILTLSFECHESDSIFCLRADRIGHSRANLSGCAWKLGDFAHGNHKGRFNPYHRNDDFGRRQR